jgi:hypothetical protein
MKDDWARLHRQRSQGLRETYDARIANCLAAIGIGSIAQIREKVGFEGIGWIDKIPALGEKSKTRILKSIGYDYKKLTPLDKAIMLLEANGYVVTKTTRV